MCSVVFVSACGPCWRDVMGSVGLSALLCLFLVLANLRRGALFFFLAFCVFVLSAVVVLGFLLFLFHVVRLGDVSFFWPFVASSFFSGRCSAVVVVRFLSESSVLVLYSSSLRNRSISWPILPGW